MRQLTLLEKVKDLGRDFFKRGDLLYSMTNEEFGEEVHVEALGVYISIVRAPNKVYMVELLKGDTREKVLWTDDFDDILEYIVEKAEDEFYVKSMEDLR